MDAAAHEANPTEIEAVAAGSRSRRVVRIEVRPAGEDPKASAAMARILAGGVARPSGLRRAAVYLVEADRDELPDEAVPAIATGLLADPVTESATIGNSETDRVVVEVHPLPGVTDPAGDSVRTAIASMLGLPEGHSIEVRTGTRWEFEGVSPADARSTAERLLANPVIHAIHEGSFHPARFPRGAERKAEVPEVPLLDLDDAALARLSRDGHLFLSLEEMRAVQAHYRGLGREPRSIELETLAQTWSEHCVHKTLKSTVRYREADHAGPSIASLAKAGRPGHRLEPDGSVVVENLLKSTVAAATHELIADGVDWCLSVFVDNSGVVAFDDRHAVCFKVETHNHPSAIEPYGGAATGIGGCIRDVIGTGLGAKPIAATDVFCVAPPDLASVPEGCLPPRRVLGEVVAGVRDYGNRMGIPTLSGAVWFDHRHVGNPLVFCGVVGLMPREFVKGAARAGDRIVALGGRTGRDGIHGATFSSAELESTHADEFGHAVQIGHAIVEKTMLDAVLAARDEPGGPLFSAITDCGAGGFSSAVGEMGESLGAEVDLERAPLKYAGLDPTEVWISEAQERMVLAVPEGNLARLAEICAEHEVEWADLGRFGNEARELVLRWKGQEVGRLAMEFLHGGVPMPVREATWPPPAGAFGFPSRDAAAESDDSPRGILAILLRLLAHPNIASKAWIIRQYDHEVQGRTAIKPLVGVGAGGPSDASVVEPVPGTDRGLAIACGLATGWESDPYLMVLAAIDECVRNLVCVGADPSRIAILDNFCWPGCGDAASMGALVRAAEACYDGAIAYRTPFISGKDSLNNQFAVGDGTTIRIPPTLLVSGFAPVESIERSATMDAKSAGNVLLLVGETTAETGGSHLRRVASGAAIDSTSDALPAVDLSKGPRIAAAVQRLIADGLVCSAHDASEGGVLVAAAEMAFAGGLGASIDLDSIGEGLPAIAAAFAETPSRYLLEIDPKSMPDIEAMLGDLPWRAIGGFEASGLFAIRCSGGEASMPIDSLRDAWDSGARIDA